MILLIEKYFVGFLDRRRVFSGGVLCWKSMILSWMALYPTREVLEMVSKMLKWIPN